MLTIKIKTGNAAFNPGEPCENDPGSEVARILRELADKFDRGFYSPGSIWLNDFNGNKVGEAVITRSK